MNNMQLLEHTGSRILMKSKKSPSIVTIEHNLPYWYLEHAYFVIRKFSLYLRHSYNLLWVRCGHNIHIGFILNKVISVSA